LSNKIFYSQVGSSSCGNEHLTKVAELLRAAKWASALDIIRVQRAQWINDPFHDDDDVTIAINIFCKHLSQDRAGKYVKKYS
jgi:hypothetical protein